MICALLSLIFNFHKVIVLFIWARLEKWWTGIVCETTGATSIYWKADLTLMILFLFSNTFFRLPAAEFLLNGGQTMCWLVGNKLVTVTTSGCSQKVLKNGLCDKCWVHCSAHSESRQSARSGSNETEDIGWASRQNSNEKSNNNTSVSSPSETDKKVGHKLEMVSSKLQQLATVSKLEIEACACWCSGWAEIYIRRPTGK